MHQSIFQRTDCRALVRIITHALRIVAFQLIILALLLARTTSMRTCRAPTENVLTGRTVDARKIYTWFCRIWNSFWWRDKSRRGDRERDDHWPAANINCLVSRCTMAKQRKFRTHTVPLPGVEEFPVGAGVNPEVEDCAKHLSMAKRKVKRST